MRALGSALVAALALCGCGRTSATAPLFSGYSRRGPIDAAAVRTEPALPQGYAALGRVDARCRADDGVVDIDEESLADVDCSDDLLREALREKAAEVGGDVLVALQCRTSEEARGDLYDSVLHVCFGNVAMPRDESGAKRSAAAEQPAWRAEDAFDVEVSFRPAGAHTAPRHAVPVDRVAELAFAPVGRVVMGDIVARGPDDVDRAAVRHAVRAAAGRVGASDVAGIACARAADGWICTGRATRPEVDEYAVR